MNVSRDLELNDDFYIKEINNLRKEKNALILAHYYQEPKIQDMYTFIWPHTKKRHQKMVPDRKKAEQSDSSKAATEENKSGYVLESF